jgi:AAA+ ATPase superfamily predicted ATPase
MNIADVLNGLQDQSKNTLANKIQKNSEVRRIKSRAESFVSQILDFLGEESKYISNGLSYSDNPMYAGKLSEEEKKELTEYLVNEIKALPEKLKTEINKFFDTTSTNTSETEGEKKEDDAKDASTEQPIKAIFRY